MNMDRRTVLTLLMCFLAVSCTRTIVSPTKAITPGTTPIAPPGPIPQSLLNDIVGDLAYRLDLGVTTVEILSIEPNIWESTAMGCPEEGHEYFKVQTPGWRVLLEAVEEVYDYRVSSEGGAYKVCSKQG